MNALPPLTAVRAFEAVARHLSFTRAAAELGMSQAAVSYQIRILEERVGTPLFLRRPRQIALSETGARLAPEITRAFDMLRASFAETGERAEGMLSLTVTNTFATGWLASQIGQFQLGHPDIAVKIDTSNVLVDFTQEEFDAGIRATGHIPPGLIGHPLAKVEFAPMLHPSLIARYDIRQPADLLRVPQISPEDPWVPAWLEMAGVPAAAAPQKPFIGLGSQYLESRAAIAGSGVAMLTPLFYADEVAAGLLVQPFDLVGWVGHHYYFVYPESRRNWTKIRAFRDWIIAATAPLRALEQS